MASVLKKRRKKMRKHKYKKLRRRQKFCVARAGAHHDIMDGGIRARRKKFASAFER